MAMSINKIALLPLRILFSALVALCLAEDLQFVGLPRAAYGAKRKTAIGDPFDKNNERINKARRKPTNLGLDIGTNWYSYCARRPDRCNW